MSKLLHAEITKEILGAAFEVHSTLGTGFLEKVYEEAMAHEFRFRGIGFQRQVEVPIYYKNILVGEHRLDLLVEGKVVVELKAIRELAEIHTSIALSYLAATHLEVAVVLNFGQASLAHKRIARSTQ